MKPNNTLAPTSLWLLFASAAAVACANNDTAREPDSEAYRRQPGYTVNSILPMDEYLRRFRLGLDTVSALAGGAPDRDSLIRAFVGAVSARDTATVRALVLTRTEFAWLYFPEHELSRPPYEVSPAYVWGQMQDASAKGITRVFERYGGQRLTYRGLTCPPNTTVVHGHARETAQCTVVFDVPDSGRRELRLFSAIIERDKRFKFLSYANDL